MSLHKHIVHHPFNQKSQRTFVSLIRLHSLSAGALRRHSTLHTDTVQQQTCLSLQPHNPGQPRSYEPTHMQPLHIKANAHTRNARETKQLLQLNPPFHSNATTGSDP